MLDLTTSKLTYLNSEGDDAVMVTVSFITTASGIEATVMFEPYNVEASAMAVIAVADALSLARHVVSGNPVTTAEADKLANEWSEARKKKDQVASLEELFGTNAGA